MCMAANQNGLPCEYTCRMELLHCLDPSQHTAINDLHLRLAGTCHASTSITLQPHQCLPSHSLRSSAPGLSLCHQSPHMLNKNVNSSKIMDLKIPTTCLPERCLSEQPTCPTSLHQPFLETKERGAWLARSIALPWCLSLLFEACDFLPSLPTHLHYPSHEWGSFYYSSFEIYPSCEDVPLRDTEDFPV